MTSRPRTLLWPALAALAGAAAAVPLWASHLLPFQDAPQHLAAIGLLAGDGSAAQQSRQWFTVDFAHAQYTGFYLPAAWLARLVGPDVAIRLLLTVCALLLPFAAWQLLRAFRRDVRLAVFAPALFHTAPLYIGVYNFVAAVPFALLAVALIERQLRSPSVWRGAGIAVLTAALLFLHLSGLVIVVGAAGALAVTAGRPWWRYALHAAVPLLPALALLVVSSTGPLPPYPVDVAVGALKIGPLWQPPIDQLHDLIRFANVLPGRVDDLVTFALFGLWVAAWRAKGPRQAPERAWRLPLLAGGLFAAYLVAPAQIGYVAYIPLRAVPFIALFTLSSPLIASTRRTSLLLGAAVAVQVFYGVHLARVYRAFDREAQRPELEQVLSAAEPGRRVLSLMLDRKSEVVHFEPYLHFGLYYQVLRGGRVRFNFAELPWMPLRFRGEPPTRVYPVYWEFTPGWFDWKNALGDADYVLVRLTDPHGDAADSPEPGPQFAEGFALKARAGRWEIFAPATPTAYSQTRKK